jgi:hypothetical protein
MHKNKAKVWGSIGGVVVVIVFLFLLGHYSAQPPKIITDPIQLTGIQVGDAPWPPELAYLRGRLIAIGLPALPQEGNALHIHQHLDIFIDGKPVAVPAGIGINKIANFISPIHVHDTSGIVHVESPVVRTFTLGLFFDIWGVRFTSQCIGGYCTTGDKTLKVYVDGTLYNGDPRQLPLASHQEIVITYGTDAALPQPIPASFTFPTGY